MSKCPPVGNNEWSVDLALQLAEKLCVGGCGDLFKHSWENEGLSTQGLSWCVRRQSEGRIDEDDDC